MHVNAMRALQKSRTLKAFANKLFPVLVDVEKLNDLSSAGDVTPIAER